MSHPMSRDELDGVRHGTITDCQCKDCRLLATIYVLRAEVVAGRAAFLCGHGHHAPVSLWSKYKQARELTDAAKILPS